MKNKGLTGSTLKWVAIIAMMIDHIGAVLVTHNALNAVAVINNLNFVPTETWLNWSIVNLAFRSIGRIAFPIFCFLLVQGFLHTHDVKKYAIRLGLFALLSEIPFDLAIARTPISSGYQNVFFTLFIGLLVLIGLQKFEKKIIPSFLVIVLGCIAAYLLRCDYSFTGVLVIAGFYQFRNQFWMCFLFVALILIMATIGELPALLAFFLIARYNGEKGKGPKYFFYAFYPIHLLLLYILSVLLPVFPI